MRIAVISDIHGNTIALDAVLEDAHAHGVDEYWLLGDYAAIGPDPVAVLERATALSRARFIRGNTDRYIVTGEAPPPTAEMVQRDPALAPLRARIAASFEWTRERVTAAGWFDWVAQLPLDMSYRSADGTRIAAIHASAGTDDGEGIHPGLGNSDIERLLDGIDADLILVGHTHEAMVRRAGARVVANVGSVSNPRTPDLRACYVLLETSGSGMQLVHRRVAYDQRAFAELVDRSGHPSADYILSFQRGAEAGRTPHRDHVPLMPGDPIPIVPESC